MLRCWRWLKSQWVRDVPEELAYCEYQCATNQCYLGEWERCQRRMGTIGLSKSAADDGVSEP